MLSERAKEALVRAALDGVPQIRFKLRDSKGGRCVMGVMADAAGLALEATNFGEMGADFEKLLRWAGIGQREMHEIAEMNDIGMDFLTIARKYGND